MNEPDPSDDFPREVNDAIKDAFVVEESDDDDEIEFDLDDFKLNVNAGLGTITDLGLGAGLPTGKTVRVRHLYFNFARLWSSLKTLAEAFLKVPANPLAVVWHLISTVKNLGENATIVFTGLEAPTVYMLASQYRFGQRVNEEELFARVSAFMLERKAGRPDQGEFARSNTNLAKLGVITIDAGSIALEEKILVRRL